ncbi:uracil-DNA glycosylase [Paenibacillus sp. N1-5-1-14]|uniref:uracil-DNA glycosylase n=1 Tax=Paenibacillus radicibacter TaxID=2972488 RepID=UPI002158CEA8|nr:uracil-DNA glycosylase [Paenibacillus radicibacter]MCR8641313.1 uracil-DNA glycosylase [Paenibacillus radicibacter]
MKQVQMWQDQLKSDWKSILGEEWNKPYMLELLAYMADEYRDHEVFPAQEQVFAALEATPYEATKVVILGQDPYHGAGQAHGMSFSVQPGVAIPPSLRNMYKELHSDLELPIPTHGCLRAWSEQGVLLLNTVLTVRSGEPLSHRKRGWETFTDEVIRQLNTKQEPVVFILWGNEAIKKAEMLDRSRHHILTSVHPSPLSARRGFFGSRPYSQTNEFLVRHGLTPIDWSIPEYVIQAEELFLHN